ncbi:MAG: type II toxin-antitoxin system VapC family toxin [Okeania sp. SIO3C4]|nr:type II toxin-antitoxin system VapC family toxin [Okeania sp. SIO3B3]NER08877.1 type II toxin-antitoxin system VapC family toxin [Okeania sp. SIO3C4]
MSNNSLIYLLDTNVCIIYLKGKYKNLKSRIDNLEAEKIEEYLKLTLGQKCQ